ncbi:peptidyl-prolyl cis-trans isomerase FKBP8-like [Tubulanus polymorphus]|uniref:peptidyl-prolyl cis-trans isomerase FKBP8-like n=1 Tax=Tubulanus polymorphus TaxID=672921 RepID=UPI003DA22C81
MSEEVKHFETEETQSTQQAPSILDDVASDHTAPDDVGPAGDAAPDDAVHIVPEHDAPEDDVSALHEDAPDTKRGEVVLEDAAKGEVSHQDDDTMGQEPVVPATEPIAPAEPAASATESIAPAEPAIPPTEAAKPATESAKPAETAAPATEPAAPTEPAIPIKPAAPATEPVAPDPPVNGSEDIGLKTVKEEDDRNSIDESDLPKETAKSTASSDGDNPPLANGDESEESDKMEDVIKPEIPDIVKHTEDADKDFMDVLGNGQIKKKVISAGEGITTRPTLNDQVIVTMKGRLSDGTLVDEMAHYEFTLGDGDVIQGLDLGIALMEKGEKAELTVQPRFAFGDMGRDPDIPPDSIVIYEVELEAIGDKLDYSVLPISKRLELGDKKREIGNKHYTRHDYASSVNSYSKALSILDESIQSPDAETADVQKMLDAQVTCYNNLAAAQLKLKAFDAAIKSCDSVLKAQPHDVKALFRKGKALTGTGETDEAVKCLRKALQLEPEAKVIHQELSKLVNRQLAEKEKEKDLYRKMFSSDSTPKPPPKKSKFSVRWYQVVAGAVGLAAVVTGIVVAALKL